MRSEIRLATERDIPGLCELWQSCFPDTEDYVRYFYCENFDRISVPICTFGSKPVSMINLMDAAFADGADSTPVRYVYAAGTLPEYRNKGLMRSLLFFAERSANENGYGLFLKPSLPLRGYYASLGFEEDSRFRVFTAAPSPDENEKVSFSDVSAEEYNRLRDEAFSDRPYVKLPDAHVRGCVDENAYCGGRTLSLSLDGGTHFLMCFPADGVLRVTETDLRPDRLRRIASALCGLFGADRIEAFLDESTCPEGDAVVSCAVFNAPLRRTYANLLLF